MNASTSRGDTEVLTVIDEQLMIQSMIESKNKCVLYKLTAITAERREPTPRVQLRIDRNDLEKQLLQEENQLRLDKERNNSSKKRRF